MILNIYGELCLIIELRDMETLYAILIKLIIYQDVFLEEMEKEGLHLFVLLINT